MRRTGMTAAALMILSAMLLSGCSQSQPGAADTGSPNPVTPSPSPVQSETPAPPDPMDEVYPVSTQEDAAKILEQAYEGLAEELTFRFTQEDLSFQDRSMLLQNASNQVLSVRPELKYAYALECADGAEGTVCKISYMPYKLGYPEGVPEGAVEVHSLSELAAAADDALGAEEIPIVIRDPELLVDDMQRALQLAGYGYVVYTLNSDATAICASAGVSETMEETVEKAQEVQRLAEETAETILTDTMDDEEKLRAIYGFIVENTTYDYRYYQDPASLPNESRTAFGLLQNGTAICGGFSWAFRLLCEEAGIPCWNVTGTGAGEEHMWNCALMDGEYRYFDTTWDAGRTDESQWRYFARTEEEITQDHFWGAGQQELIHALTRQ